MMIVFPSDPPFSTTLCDLPAPVGLVQIGDRVEECLILKHLERFRDRSMDTSQQEEKKKEAEKKKKTIPNIIRIPNQTRGR